MKIHEENEKNPGNTINLKGFAVGSGFFDPYIQSDYGEYFYNLGLIDESQKLIFDTEHKVLGEHIDIGNWNAAYTVRFAQCEMLPGTISRNYSHYFNFSRFYKTSSSDGQVLTSHTSKTQQASTTSPTFW